METVIEQVSERLEISYPIVDAAIDAMRDRYLAIQVSGFNDKENYDLARKALSDTKATRVAIERAEREKVVAEARRVQEEKDAAERLERQRLEAEQRQAEAVKAAKEEAERKAAQAKAIADRKASEDRRKAEEEAARKIANAKLFDEIKASFPTLESAWTEIARLRTERAPLFSAV